MENIATFRNVLVHQYLGLDYEAIWGVVENRLSELEPAIERMSRVVASIEETPSGPPEPET